jgi:hypothetical protein
MLSMGQEASAAKQYLEGAILSKWKVSPPATFAGT